MLLSHKHKYPISPIFIFLCKVPASTTKSVFIEKPLSTLVLPHRLVAMVQVALGQEGRMHAQAVSIIRRKSEYANPVTSQGVAALCCGEWCI